MMIFAHQKYLGCAGFMAGHLLSGVFTMRTRIPPRIPFSSLTMALYKNAFDKNAGIKHWIALRGKKTFCYPAFGIAPIWQANEVKVLL